MKTRFASGRFLAAVLIWFGVTFSALPQSSFVLHNFARWGNSGGIAFITNLDGYSPNGCLTWSGTNFYGTAQSGGTNGNGTLFAVNTNGLFSLLYTFPTNDPISGANLPGATPNGGLVLSGSTLYGTAQSGGSSGNGAIFSISTNGTGITALHNFAGGSSDGASPSGGLVMGGSTLFGTTQLGGSPGNGVVFSLTGSTFSLLHPFTAGNYNDIFLLTNYDGANPYCQLLLVGTNLYGTTSQGGTNGYGTIFRIGTNGGGFTTLHHFDSDEAADSYAGLVYSGGWLYGIGGSVVYTLSTNGSGYTNLVSFNYTVDGSSSPAGLTVSNGVIYAAAPFIGTNGWGQVFALLTNGADYTSFHDFTTPSALTQSNLDGATPNGSPVLLNNSLYGVSAAGGTNGSGMLFRATQPIVVSAQRSGTNLQLNFPTFPGLGYSVQQCTNLLTAKWTAVTNFTGAGTNFQLSLALTNPPNLFFRTGQ